MKAWFGAFLLCGLMAGTAAAQGAAPLPPPTPAPYVMIRNPMIDAGIFVVLAGGAIFAVCRTSQRV